MDALHSQILHQFQLVGEPVSCERYGFGHINETYLVVTEQQTRYILQKINHHIFKDVPALMGNIAAVTNHLAKQTDDPRRVHRHPGHRRLPPAAHPAGADHCRCPEIR